MCCWLIGLVVSDIWAEHLTSCRLASLEAAAGTHEGFWKPLLPSPNIQMMGMAMFAAILMLFMCDSLTSMPDRT